MVDLETESAPKIFLDLITNNPQVIELLQYYGVNTEELPTKVQLLIASETKGPLAGFSLTERLTVITKQDQANQVSVWQLLSALLEQTQYPWISQILVSKYGVPVEEIQISLLKLRAFAHPNPFLKKLSGLT